MDRDHSEEPIAPSIKSREPPFIVRLYYRTGAFHRMNEFTSASHLPLYVEIPAWRTTTLDELSLDLANEHHLTNHDSLLPHPAIGTRLVFRLIYVDTRKDSSRHVSKDLGSVVIGAGLPGADSDAGLSDDDPCYEDAHKTLGDAKFMPGDFISCAILPPNDLDGAVEPVSAARTGRGSGIGEGRSTAASPPPPGPRGRDGDRYGRDRFGDEPQQARGYNRGGNGGGGGRYESNFYDWGGRREHRGGGRNNRQRETGNMPTGDWRRGF
ncbi:Sin3 associated polypeptide p18-domain-containing protein [Sordaria brevicollis]|uniref:Sin3 associated polypeptide p18-domain-containing protein n=1 Tax=Sordaria brevicollis TaxID=83679 RepID=A0AAE0P211_SORBR|nr:Sin3 associated polypeptide p18-domain-containing protein [Sordaria brevicollis]